jgi:hypothetical protein
MNQRKYDSTVARMAGNIAAGTVEYFARPNLSEEDARQIAVGVVKLARAIIAEVERTEPPVSAPPVPQEKP